MRLRKSEDVAQSGPEKPGAGRCFCLVPSKGQRISRKLIWLRVLDLWQQKSRFAPDKDARDDTLYVKPRARESCRRFSRIVYAASSLKTAKVGAERCKIMAGSRKSIRTIGVLVHSEAHANAMRGTAAGGDTRFGNQASLFFVENTQHAALVGTQLK
jgi:hypothetical protein